MTLLILQGKVSFLFLCVSWTIAVQALAFQELEPIQQVHAAIVSTYEPEEPQRDPINIGPATIETTGTDDEIVLTGRDGLDRTWKVFIATASGYAESRLWKANLDGDQVEDLILVHQNRLIGKCHDQYRVTIIVFDGEGKPLPWELEGFFAVDWTIGNHRGILDLGKWAKSGSTELLDIDCSMGSDDPVEPYGYSLRGVYELHDGLWRRLTPEDRETHQRIATQHHQPWVRSQKHFAADYSNAPTRGVNTRIFAFIPRVEPYCGIAVPAVGPDGQFTQSPESVRRREWEHCKDHFLIEGGVKCFSNPAIVLNGPDGTEAVMDGHSERAKAFIMRIIADKLPVTLTGQLEEGACSPAMIWATRP